MSCRACLAFSAFVTVFGVIFIVFRSWRFGVLAIVPLSFSSGSLLVYPLPGWSTRWYDRLFAQQATELDDEARKAIIAMARPLTGASSAAPVLPDTPALTQGQVAELLLA